MINIQNICLQQGSTVLIDQSSAIIYAGQKVGVVGKNGSGKSSLFKAMLGQLDLHGGVISLQKSDSIAYIEQYFPSLTRSALDHTISGDEKIFKLMQKLQTAEQNNQMEIAAELHFQMAEQDAYSAPARAAKILNGLGFQDHELNKPVGEFSGGWRVRLNLAKCLMNPQDLMLLDEPTNHLDLEAVLWLQQWLNKYTGTLLLISHDRDFIDACVNHVMHICNRQIKMYTGNYSSFEEQRALALALQSGQYQKQQRHIQHMMNYVNRFRAKSSKAKQAQSRLKAIERMEKIPPVIEEGGYNFEFKQPDKLPNPLVDIRHGAVGYDSAIILKNLNLTIRAQSRIGLLGLNGAGKSTLIKLMASELAIHSGQFHLHRDTKVGYFAQHQVEQLDEQLTALETMEDIDSTASTSQLRAYLGSYAFSHDKALRPVGTFSGGEKARLALACIIWQKPNLLLLDEPTNHLDLDMRETLTLALQSYPGALIVVAHDRYLLRNTVDEFWLTHDGTVTEFNGDLDDYQNFVLAPTPKKESNKNKSPPIKITNKNQLTELEKEIANLEKELVKIDHLIIELSANNNTLELQQAAAQRKKLAQQLTEKEKQWFEEQ